MSSRYVIVKPEEKIMSSNPYNIKLTQPHIPIMVELILKESKEKLINFFLNFVI